jgi:hypothetical protein
MLDIAGREISEGDYIVYAQGSRYVELEFGRVVRVNKASVRLVWLQYSWKTDGRLGESNLYQSSSKLLIIPQDLVPEDVLQALP